MLNQALAKAIFISGSPLSLVEHPLWIEFFKKIRPAYTVPSRCRISTTYLDAEYIALQAEIKEELSNSNNLHLQCDGWSNLRNESIIDFVVTTPVPRFVDFLITGENRHDAAYLSQEMKKIIEKYGAEKFLVVIGDNASNMRAAFRSLQKIYDHIIPLGCLAHLLHLLCNDILNCESVKSFMNQVTDIIKTIKNSHLLHALFIKIGKEKKVNISLKLAGKTRWGSHLHSLQSIYTNKVVLQTLAVSDETSISSQLKNRLLDDSIFWLRVEKMTLILKPIVDLITKLESNEPLIHIVHTKINELEKLLVELLPQSPLMKAEENRILKKIAERKEFAIGKIHVAASLLDPLNQGCNLSPVEIMDAFEFICNTASSMKLPLAQVKAELSDYRDKQGIWARKFIWEGIASPLAWWRGLRGTNLIAEIAIRILSAPVTSAATERTFSTFSWIHSNKRNRLTTERAAKIAYLSHNWKLKNKADKKPFVVSYSSELPRELQTIEQTPSASTSASTSSTSITSKMSHMPKKRKLFSDDVNQTSESESEMEEEDIPYADSGSESEEN